MPLTLSKSSRYWFFDSAKVTRLITVGQVRALSKIGAFVRQRARTSMRKRKGASKPNTPPSVQIGTLRNMLFFAYDPTAQTVVIGPVGLGRNIVPGLHEFGGSQTLQKTLYSIRTANSQRQADAYREKVKAGQIVPTPKAKRTVVASYPARSYMGPAMEKEIAAKTFDRAFAGTFGPG